MDRGVMGVSLPVGVAQTRRFIVTIGLKEKHA